MVGQKNRLKLAEVSAKLIGKPFIAGWKEYEDGKGLDCFTLVIEYLRLRGKVITGEYKFKGYKAKNYLKIYKESKVKGIGLVIGLLRTFMTEVHKNFTKAGDVLVIKNKKVKDAIIHFGIECGNNRIIVAITDKQIEIMDKKYFEVIGAFTWAVK
jgi:cell wall-associated NlpC family hydrolase